VAITTRVRLNIFNETEITHLFKGSVVIVDQGIVSGIRFFIALLLARYVTPAEYGGFVIAYGILMLFGYLQTAFILTPMSVLGPALQNDEKKVYYGSLLKLQGILAILVTVFLLLTSGIWPFFFKETGLKEIFIAMSLSIVGVQMQEFFRRLFLNNFKVNSTVSNDIFCYLGQVVVIFFLIWKFSISAVSIFYVISAFSIIAALLGFIKSRQLFDLKSNQLRMTFIEQWTYGKWLLASMITQWITGQIYIYISALFLNMSSVGILGACRNLFGVINVTLIGIKNFVLPYAARKFVLHGSSFLKLFLKRIYIVGSIGVFLYVLAVSLFSPNILEFLYKGKYNGFEYVVVLFAVQTLISFYVFPPNTGLLLIRKPEAIFKSNLISAIVSFLIALPCIYIWGLVGALMGMIITQVILVMFMTNIYRTEFIADVG
jgi:O-antigen/teichoic acid export membrane protein